MIFTSFISSIAATAVLSVPKDPNAVLEPSHVYLPLSEKWASEKTDELKFKVVRINAFTGIASKYDAYVLSDAADDLRAMAADYKASTGKDLVVNSAYRSVKFQEKVRVANPTVAARAWRSEHHLGTALDFRNADGSLEWLSKFARRYGFVNSYSKRCETETGIPAEPWHYRWVGRDFAPEMSECPIRDLRIISGRFPETERKKALERFKPFLLSNFEYNSCILRRMADAPNLTSALLSGACSGYLGKRK